MYIFLLLCIQNFAEVKKQGRVDSTLPCGYINITIHLVTDVLWVFFRIILLIYGRL
jgi:hypothetical protein